MTVTFDTQISTKQKINFLTIRMGGGHYATLHALSAIIKQEEIPWEIQITDIDKILEEASTEYKFIDPLKAFSGIPAYEFWNYFLKKGWTWLQAPLIWFFKLAIKFFHKTSIKIFQGYWWEQNPDLVVSLVPLYNRIVWETLQKAKPGTPFVTILTDFADCPHEFWIEPSINSHVVCGTKKAVEQAHELGVKPEKIFQTSGMVIHPRFYQPITHDGDGLPFENGSIDTHFEKQRLGFFFIGKPGPGSISEALAMKLPVIVERNFATLIPERYNTQWVEEKQVGLVIPSFCQIDKAVLELIKPNNYLLYRKNAIALNNQAVFEAVQIISSILQTTSPHTPEPNSIANEVMSRF
ncbi:MAG: hypothetical protein AAF378_07090 [Cyanobacteria bacterium P01_A01_bin.84]